jgi:hypothetical protein
MIPYFTSAAQNAVVAYQLAELENGYPTEDPYATPIEDPYGTPANLAASSASTAPVTASRGGSFDPKASWDLARRGVQAKIIPGMNTGGGKALHDNYHLEALDPKHRMADLLKTMWVVFRAELKGGVNSDDRKKRSVFYNWLDEVCLNAPNEVRAELKGAKFPDSMIEHFISAGVDYLVGSQRKSYELEISLGVFNQNKKLFDTKDNRTHFSGKGWAIYVVSPEGTWYAGSHIIGKFHHSSFLSGRPILSAGELQVENGVLTKITAKSGHYKPSFDQFIAGLKDLKSKNVKLDSAEVVVYDKNRKVPSEKTLIPVFTFLSDPLITQKYDTFG